MNIPLRNRRLSKNLPSRKFRREEKWERKPYECPFPVPQSGVQASPLLQRLRGLLPAGHQVLQLRLAALLFRRQAGSS